MTAVLRSGLYSYFQTGDKPSAAQFVNLIDSSLNLVDPSTQTINSTIILGAGQFVLNGVTSGAGTIGVPAVAGATTFNIPASNGTSGQFLITDGAGNTSWSNSSISIPNPLTLGLNGGTGGSVILEGSSSGAVSITVPAVAGTTNFKLPDSNGTNAQFLTTDGGGNTSWATPPSAGGALVLLNTQNAIGASSISFSSIFITNAYNKYVIEFDGVYAASNMLFYIAISTNDGISYLASNYANAGSAQALNSSTTGGYANTTPAIDISAGGAAVIGTAVATASNGSISFTNPSASQPIRFIFNAFIFSSNNASTLSNAFYVQGIGQNSGTTPINNIKIYDGNTGAAFTGNFHLYGVSGT